MTGNLTINSVTSQGKGTDNGFTGTYSGGRIDAGSKANLRTDDEGGNLQLLSPAGALYEMDAYNGNLRIWHKATSASPDRFLIMFEKDTGNALIYGNLKVNGTITTKGRVL